MSSIMKIENLQATIGDKEILKGLNLELEPGKVHAIMGPNGAGKSTLSKALVGHYDVELTGGDIIYKGENINEMEAEERALNGIFLSFQASCGTLCKRVWVRSHGQTAISLIDMG